MRLILIRHGQPLTGDVAHAYDPPLTALGREQAEAAARALVVFRPDRLITSGMRRADETAQAASAMLGLDIAVDHRFAEVDYGGKPYLDGHMMRARGKQAWEAFLRNPVAEMGGNEAEMTAHLRAALHDLFTQHAGTDQTIAVFCHTFPINLITSFALGAPGGARLTRYQPAFCSFTRLIGSSTERMALQAFGEAQHVLPYPPLT